MPLLSKNKPTVEDLTSAEMRRRYEFIVNTSHDFMTLINQDYEYQAVNQAYCKAHRKSRGSLLGKTVAEVWGEDAFNSIIKKYLDECFNGNEVQYEAWFEFGKDQKRYFNVSYYPYKNSKDLITHVVVISRDITERKKVEEALERRDRINRAFSFAAERFLAGAGQEWREKTNHVLTELGTAVDVSRVYIFKNKKQSDGSWRHSYRYEWCAKGVNPEINNPELQDASHHENGLIRWEDVLEHGGVIHGNVDTFPKSEQAVLEKQGIKSILVVPIFIHDQWWGYIGFDECREKRTWHDIEIDALKTAANTISAAIQRKRIEDSLRESEQRFRSIYENSPLGVTVVSLDYAFITANPALCEMLQYPEHELIGKKFIEVTHPDHISTNVENAQKLVEGKIPVYRDEKRYISKLGVEFWAAITSSVIRDEVGKPLYFLSTIEDITERKQAEEDLKAHAQALEIAKAEIEHEKAEEDALLASIGEGIFATDQEGRIVLMNEPAQEMLRLELGKVIGKRLSDAIDLVDERGESVPESKRPIDQVIKHGVQVSSSEYSYVRKDGTKFSVAITSSPVMFEGKLSGAIVVFRDITDEKAVDKAKSEFVSLASHQLYTPLSTVKWYSEALLHGLKGKLDTKHERYLKEIYRANQRMVDLVNTFLNLSRIELGVQDRPSEPVDLDRIADSVVEDLLPQIEKKKLSVNTQYEPEIPQLSMDVELLRTIFQNLISNAVKYSNPEGSISVTITPVFETDEGIDSEYAPGVKISVSDTGHGIPPEEHSRIFSKYYRTEYAKGMEAEGTGLGLYILKRIIDVFGGTIVLDSEVGSGASFHVLIPSKTNDTV